MDDLVGAQRGGTRRAFPWRVVPLLLLTALIGGCGARPDATAAPPHPLAADLDRLRSTDGLLFPPELWGALSVSARSEVLRNMALGAIGEQITWSLPPSKLHEALARETDELTAASLLAQAGLDHTVDGSLAARWLAESERQLAGPETLERLWHAAVVARGGGHDAILSTAGLDKVRALLSDPSPMVQRQAYDILVAAGSAPEQAPASRAWIARVTMPGAPQEPQQLAQELHAWVTMHPGSGELNLDPGYWKPLLDWVTVGDETYSYAVRAFAAAGRTAFARELAARFDQRRLLPGGQVLEPPIFSGSLGSTFRMIRFLASEGTLGHLKDPAALISAMEPLLSRDLSHRLAGTAAAYLLRPDSVPYERRRAVIADATADIGTPTGRPLSAEEAMAWISVAEHAAVLEVPVAFPGLSAAGRRTLLDPRDEALYAVARLLLALHMARTSGSTVVTELAEHLSRSLRGRDAWKVGSLLLFAGALALRTVGAAAPFTDAQLRTEIDHRRGQCLGGFAAFIREQAAPGTACNVEATRYALALHRTLG